MATRKGRTGRALGVVMALASVAGLGAASAGWACVPVSTVNVTPDRARPGEQVEVSGIRFVSPAPVVLRLRGLDGPVVATIEMPRSANTLFKATITVPPDTPPGPLVVVATQDAFPEGGFAPWGVPTRAIITVLDPAGNAPPSTVPAVQGRPADLAREGVDTAPLVFTALAVAAGALMVVGLASLLASRAGKGPEPAAVDAGTSS